MRAYFSRGLKYSAFIAHPPAALMPRRRKSPLPVNLGLRCRRPTAPVLTERAEAQPATAARLMASMRGLGYPGAVRYSFGLRRGRVAGVSRQVRSSDPYGGQINSLCEAAGNLRLRRALEETPERSDAGLMVKARRALTPLNL